jgi:hypothetical protein
MTALDAEVHKELSHIMHQTATGISVARWLTKAFEALSSSK